MVTLSARLMALEGVGAGDHPKPLPRLVPDATTDTELARLRQHGRDVLRESDPAFIDLFV